jgi:23S rRNA (guanosine2251-2'-O)-methyltransferase
LTKRKLEPPPATIIYGVHPVIETLRSRRRVVEHVYCSRGRPLNPVLVRALDELSIPMTQVPPEELLARTGSTHHQGLAAKVGPFPYVSLDAIVSEAGVRSGVLVLLDEVQDPANVGSIIRSAECLGARGVVLTKGRAAAVTPAVEKVAAGAAAHLPLARVINLVRTMEDLKAEGYWIYGATAEARQVYTSVDLTGLVALVLGSEGKGLRRLVRERCDGAVSIPMTGMVTSLNVAQTAAILLAEAQRQRLKQIAPRSERGKTAT